MEDTGVETPVFRVDPKLEQEQAAALAKRRAERDNARAAQSLARIEATARGTDNLMPHIVEAVSARATIGEICTTLASVLGRHREGGRRA